MFCIRWTDNVAFGDWTRIGLKKMLISESWRILSNYESVELILKMYSRCHNEEISRGHAREIASAFVHARSYFSAAATSNITIKPLILYYGVMALSRGAYLFLKRGASASSIEAGHGLSPSHWRRVLSAENPNFASLKVGFQSKGSFTELNDAVAGASLLRHGSSELTHVFPASREDLVGKHISLGEIVLRIPDLRDNVIRWKNKLLVTPTEINDNGDEVNFRIIKNTYGLGEYRVYNKIFCNSIYNKIHEDDLSVNYIGPKESDKIIGATDFVDRNFGNFFSGTGDIWLYPRYCGDFTLAKLPTLFVLSFILSLLVRYHPNSWTSLLSGIIEDSALPTLLSATAHVELEFPRVLVDHLEYAQRLGSANNPQHNPR